MPDYDNSKFRELLARAIGSSTQQSFAERAGIAPQQLSRYLREDYKSKPSQKTLRKIADAAKSDQLYSELMAACGYAETPAMARKRKSFEERAFLNAQDLQAGLREFTRGSCVYESIEAFIRAYEPVFSTETITEIYVNEKREYEGAAYHGAEYVAAVRLKFENLIQQCCTWVALYYAETRSGNVVVLAAAMDPESIMKAGGITEEYYNAHRDEQFVYRIESKLPKGKHLVESLLEIFDTTGDSYPYMHVGFGFYLPECPENFLEFLRKHKDAFCTGKYEKEFYDSVVSAADPEATAADYEYDSASAKGYLAMIAKIMTEETDLPFDAIDNSDELCTGNTPCIILIGAISPYGDISDAYNIEELKEICSEYAKELGVTEYGEVHAAVRHTVSKRNVFSIQE